jgi:hypothetical protein
MLKFLAGLILPAAALLGAGSGEAFVPTFESRVELTPQNKIDDLVFARLKQLGIQPANLCSDAVFLRRAYLDVIGTVPTAREANQFLRDPDPHKRAALIDQLLERPEFADYWAMKWSDLLRIKAEFPINLWPNAAQAYHHWILSALRENLPYDQFAREMLTESGSNFRAAPVNFYRAMQSKDPQAIAQTVALTFMGARAEKWPKERLADMSAFFSNIGYKETGEWKEEIVLFDPAKAPLPRQATFPDGTAARLTADRDPREVFAAWLTSGRNPAFTGPIVNRIWSWLLGRGIIQEPDDIRPDNPPENPELLAYLQRELVASKFDLKHIYRLILNSRTYQLSSIPHPGNGDKAGADADKHFAYYPLRRLDAEVLIDAICQITGTTEKYSSAIPEPFTFIPDGQRSISLPDGSITSSFLEQFGRPPRDTGLESERNNRLTASQSLHLLNSSHIQQKIERSPRLNYLVQTQQDPKVLVSTLYLMILSRYPTPEEFQVVMDYSKSGKARGREATVDLIWSLMNSAEFLYRH